MIQRVAIAVVGVLLLTFVACGEDLTPAEKTLKTTEDNLSEVRSGKLKMELLASPAGAARGRGSGFLIRGPFATGKEKGDLPVANLQYTRITGARRRTTAFISTGKSAFVQLDGRVYELDDDQVEDIRVTDTDEAGGLDGLALDDWLDNPHVSKGPVTDGVATDRITGKVDAIPALNDLLALASSFAAEDDDDAPKKLEGKNADHVRRAVRSASVEILTGKKDRLLRHIDLVIKLSVRDNEAGLRRALKGLAGADLRLDLDVDGVNKPVRVSTPKNARPSSEIPD